MIIDAHNHLGQPVGLWSAGQSAEKLVADMKKGGVEKAVALPYIEYTDMIPAMNDYVAQSVKKYPEQLIGFFVLNPWHKERALSEFDRCTELLKLKGLKLHPFLHSYPLSSHSLLDPIFEKCVRKKIPIICHGSGDSTFHTPSQFGEMAETFPEVPLIMAHMGFWQQTEDAIAKASKYDNLFLETAYVPDIDVIREAAEKVGPEKIVFGSDTPGTSFRLEIMKIKEALPKEKYQELVLGGNLARILGIK